MLRFRSSKLLKFIHFRTLILLLFLLNNKLILALFRQLFTLLNNFINLTLQVSHCLHPTLNNKNGIFQLRLIKKFTLYTKLRVAIRLGTLTIPCPNCLLFYKLLPLLRRLSNNAKRRLRTALRHASLRVNATFHTIPRLRIFRFSHLPNFGNNFLLQTSFRTTGNIKTFPLIDPRVLRFIHMPIPTSRRKSLPTTFQIFSFDSTTRITDTLRIALFLLNRPIFVRQTLRRFFILLRTIRLKCCHTILYLVRERLSVNEFRMRTTRHPQGNMNITKLMTARRPIRIPHIFRNINNSTSFFRILPISF